MPETCQSDGYLVDSTNLTNPTNPSVKRVSRPACQRCHKNRERCQFDHGQQSCCSCRRLRLVCQARPKKRMGRKPVVALSSSHGSYSVICLDPAIRRHDRRSAGTRYSGRSTAVGGTGACACAQVTAIHTSSASSEDSPVSSESDAHAPGYSPHRDHVARILTTKAAFFTANRRFIAGPSFSEDFRACALLVFARAPRVLGDAYHALLSLMESQPSPAPNPAASDVTMGLQSLRDFTALSAPIACVDDAAVVVMLGQMLLAYNAILPLGSSTRTITRSTLLSTKDWYPALLRDAKWDAISITPVFVDTVDCLMRRAVPVLRLPHTARPIVDRLCGLCTSLLPLLYDLCEASHAAATTPPPSAANAHDDDDAYTEIESRITAWTPHVPPDLATTFTASEQTLLHAQAHAYKAASLLLIHRLRHPLGTHDVPASHLASDVLTHLSPLHLPPLNSNPSSTSATGLALDFPLLLAMLEQPRAAGALFRALEPLRYRARQAEDLLAFVEVVNGARREGFKGRWFELVGRGFRGDFLP